MVITVLTPEKELFRGPINSVKVPGSKGQFQVLKNHAPIVSSLDAGVITIETSAGEYRYFDIETGTIRNDSAAGKTITFQIRKGFIEVLRNEVSLLVQMP